jgi:hypothetical protein
LKSKTVDDAYLCVNCYYKELVALSGKECSSCDSTTTSSIWYNSKAEKGKYLCAKCYSRDRKRLLREQKEQEQGKAGGKTTTTAAATAAKKKK